MWLYNGEVIESIEADASKIHLVLFIKLLTLQLNEKYLGKKVLYFNRTLPPLKGAET